MPQMKANGSFARIEHQVPLIFGQWKDPQDCQSSSVSLTLDRFLTKVILGVDKIIMKLPTFEQRPTEYRIDIVLVL